MTKRKVYRIEVFCGDYEFTNQVHDEIKTFIDYAETAAALLNNEAMNAMAIRNK